MTRWIRNCCRFSKFVAGILPWVTIIVVVGVGGSLLENWLKIKNGYPLE